MSQISSRLRAPLCVALAALASCVTLGCSSDPRVNTTANPGAAGSGLAGGGSGSGGGGGTTGLGGAKPMGCEATTVTTQKRVVRLTDNQLVNTYTALFGATTAATFIMGEDIPPAANRDFPPLATQGTSLAQGPWDLRDRMATKAMTYVGSNLATLTTCGATPTDANCAQTAVRALWMACFAPQ